MNYLEKELMDRAKKRTLCTDAISRPIRLDHIGQCQSYTMKGILQLRQSVDRS